MRPRVTLLQRKVNHLKERDLIVVTRFNRYVQSMPANDHEFRDEARRKNLDFARGYVPGSGKMTGGITFPVEAKISKGTILARVGHSRFADGSPMPDWVNLTSPWWMTASTFLEIASRGQDAGTDLQHMVRMKLALTPAFGVADTLFRVVTKDSLRVWNGRARPVMEDPDPAIREAKGLPLAWLGGYEIAQSFIPGLRDFDKRCPTKCALDTLAVVPKVPLAEYSIMRPSGFDFSRWPWPV